MPNLRIICWNIQDVGKDQVDDPDFVSMMVELIHHHGADLVCILEAKADAGLHLGDRVQAGLDVKTLKTWRSHSSTKSGPKSSKPEHYIFLWETGVVTNATNFRFPTMPAKVGFINTHIKSRFPYMGDFTVNGKTITVIGFHTCFTNVDIVESNQNLAQIPEIRGTANVILMGDFNDKAAAPGERKHRRGRASFTDLYTLSATAAHCYSCPIDVPTSLKEKTSVGGAMTTAAVRLSEYDHFFWRSTGAQLSAPVATVVDVIDDLMSAHYLHDIGKTVYNNWADRKNVEESKPAMIKRRHREKKEPWVDLVPFGAAHAVTTVAEAHKIYRDGISDHLPIRMVIVVS